jgi:hypothetical protein
MIRTQISLTDEQMTRLRAEARRRGVSIARVVRDAVDSQVPDAEASRQSRHERALAVAGAFRSMRGDLAAHHDELLGDERW